MTMKITPEDVKFIIDEYERLNDEEEQNARKFYADDDNTGFSYDYMTRDDMCRTITARFNETRGNEDEDAEQQNFATAVAVCEQWLNTEDGCILNGNAQYVNCARIFHRYGVRTELLDEWWRNTDHNY